MRRLNYFSDGTTGAGLLVLRITLAAELISDALRRLHETGQSSVLAPAVECLVTALVLVGFFTVPAAALVFALEVAMAVYLYPAAELSFLLAGLALSLAIAGPGAWSVDARLFGLRRIEIDSASDN